MEKYQIKAFIKRISGNLKSSQADMSRRKFVGANLATATAFTVIPAHVLAGNGRKSPSDKLNVVPIGIGNVGSKDLNRKAF